MSYPHRVDNYACPCGPQFYVLCTECGQDEDGPPADPDCWKCAGAGEVEVSADEAQRAFEMDRTFIHVVHRHMPGDPGDGSRMAINSRSRPNRIDDDQMFAENEPEDDGLSGDIEC